MYSAATAPPSELRYAPARQITPVDGIDQVLERQIRQRPVSQPRDRLESVAAAMRRLLDPDAQLRRRRIDVVQTPVPEKLPRLDVQNRDLKLLARLG